ncbi:MULTISPECIES: DUF3486 family protein [Neisseriaceae]|uniref:Protein of uncharacterized function (DUF3486) n=2 Tax=Neisseriaceae TaxID=481 RepID=A0A378UU42_BERDE|nr:MULTISPECIES: DUF3486 family protein [Neisseriaceae]QEY23517.1 DUF3486 family protein [Neisseria animalis]ROW32117.1 DUF3486 family protein [Neisseria animalis]STZ76072.1 Protein of uncharacterised function (DUF3486) [Bergeriella denitrificans]STZ77488.1 Protein of uncharacterised function (DUF3486) [Bergeriella denitrificans]STZ83048.1 Protein of uncharacterised function (DUF3486) [Bergeriella denitrificans]
MARRSTVEQLPEAVRHEFERKLVENGFADYQALAGWLQAQGYEISRSAAHRYGQKVEKRFKSIKASTEAARLLAEKAADDDNKLSAALTAMIQDELFNALVEVGEQNDMEAAERLGMMAATAKNIAPLISATTRLKQFQTALQDKMARKFAELEAESAKQGSGLDADTLKRIRQEVYGVFS